jgi:hypothetical protein
MVPIRITFVLVLGSVNSISCGGLDFDFLDAFSVVGATSLVDGEDINR